MGMTEAERKRYDQLFNIVIEMASESALKIGAAEMVLARHNPQIHKTYQTELRAAKSSAPSPTLLQLLEENQKGHKAD